MGPQVRDRCAESFEDEAIGVIPDTHGMFREMHNQFLTTISEEAFNFRCLINLDVPEQNFILEVPYLKLLTRMCNEQVIGERDLYDVEIDNKCCSLDHEELFCSLDAVESNGSFVAIANAGVSVIIC